jgi:3-dehydroquinate synthase
MSDGGQILVRAGDAQYPVIFGDYRRRLAKYINPRKRVVIISNPTVYALHGPALVSNIIPGGCEIIPLIIGDGERYKNLRTVRLIYDHVLDIGVERGDVIVAFGGGVVMDTGGFAAATFKRGIGLIHIPTTLLAMVDAAIGGKVAVNHAQGKNLIGAFYQPLAVAIRPEWLATLGQREMTEGLAEMIKAGLLSSHTTLEQILECGHIDPISDYGRFEPAIKRAIQFKAEIVAKDTLDVARRQILNFGHTFAHAIEQVEGYRRYRHGEAVMAGMAGALYLSYATGHMSKRSMIQLTGYLKPFMNLLPRLDKSANDYLIPMSVDKKRKQRRAVFVLLKRIGRPVFSVIDSRAVIIESIEYMQDFVNNRGEM